MLVYLPAEEESATEASTGTDPYQSGSHISATLKFSYSNAITLEGKKRYTPTQRRMIASHYHCPTIPIFEENYLHLGNGLASSGYSKFVSHADSIPDEDVVHPPKITTNLPPLGDYVTNSDKAIAAVLNGDDARYMTVTKTSTDNKSSASTQPTQSRKLNPNFNFWRNSNVDNNVVMKGLTEEIPDRSVAG